MPAAALRCWQDVPPGWEALARTDPGATPGHQPALWHALIDALPGCSLRVIGLEMDGVAVAGAPVLIQRRAGLHWLQALPFLLPAAPIAHAGGHAAADPAIARGMADLQREVGAVGGAWACYRPGPIPLDAAEVEGVSGFTRHMECAVIDLAPGTGHALRVMDRKERQGLQRARATGLETREEPEALAAAVALHARQAREWRGHRPPPIELSRRLLVARAGQPPAARLFTCRDSGGLLSAVLVLDAPHECLLWWSGTHPEGRRRNAFAVLAWSVVEWAAANGRARVNLGASTGLERVGAFKLSMGARIVRYPVRWLDARHAPLAGRVIGALQERMRRGRARGSDA